MTIKEMRALLGLTQQAFADKYGIPKRNIENWETGKNAPPEWAKNLLEKAVLEDSKEEKRMGKYIVIDEKRNGIGEIFDENYETAKEAVESAEGQWSHLTAMEQKARTIYVLESVNPDEDAEDHFDGNIIWQDGAEKE